MLQCTNTCGFSHSHSFEEPQAHYANVLEVSERLKDVGIVFPQAGLQS